MLHFLILLINIIICSSNYTINTPFYNYINLPISYDLRDIWSITCPSVNMIWEQDDCGTCSYIASVSTITDRLCIQSNGFHNLILSPMDAITCCLSCNSSYNICDGGYVDMIWQFWQTNGLVTDECKPYNVSLTYNTCNTQCNNPNTSYIKYYGKNIKIISYDEVNDIIYEIQKEIYLYGSITGTMNLYDDFKNYTTGVYEHNTILNSTGLHAVKIIGWTEDAWIIANSWGTSFGITGFFKIKKGTNECGIENKFVTGYI